jgi:hypothetical protein
MQYPIEIRQLLHGEIKVVYDTELTSPLQSLESNIIPHEDRRSVDRTELIYFEFEVQQFKVNSSTGAISSATGFNQDIELEDEFHYARIYYKNSANGTWIEVRTTHTDQVYDSTVPTVALRLDGKTLNVRIPQIYISNNSIQGTLRVDIYETKGPINLIMDNYKPESFTARWKNIDTAYNTPYAAVINVLTHYAYSTRPVNSGTPALTFEQLRKRVIANSIGDRLLPVTNVQIESSLEKKGYSVVQNIDVVTNRAFLATRPLPKPVNEKLITAGASSIETFITSIESAVTYQGVKNNGPRVTLTPELVYVNNVGVINIFPKQNLNILLNSGPDNIANNVTNNNYLYTPFHYVLDTTGNEFEMRPYYLDKPVAKSIKFIDQNDTTQLQINTAAYDLVRRDSGFVLSVATKSNDAVLEIADNALFAQLSFVPKYEQEVAYLNGVMVGRSADNERIFEFDLGTNFDLDGNDNLALTEFLLLTLEPRITHTSLSNQFNIVYSTNTVPAAGFILSNIDQKLGRLFLPENVFGITEESIDLLFGYSLKTLWARSRSVVTASNFQLYTQDVPWVYQKDVYVTDPINGSTMSIDEYGDISYTLLHRQGDSVLDINGLPTFRYRIGDPVLDVNNQPIPIEQNKVTRQLDLMFIEGSYYFATDTAAAAYREEIVSAVVEWLTVELKNLSANLIEQTKLFFYPKTTMGKIKVFADDGQTSLIEAGQYFIVDLYVTKETYANNELRESLRKSTISTIDDLLKSPTISTSTIISELRSKYNNDVVSLKLSGLGGAANLTALTVVNDGDRCNIRKRLIKLADDKLIVEEDVTINFIQLKTST